MAQIMKIKEFVHQYTPLLGEDTMRKLMDMKPGEHEVIVFGDDRKDDLVFVRVTEYHMSTMSVYEINGVE